MKILLTGGFGYVGGRLAQMLAATTNYDMVLGTRWAAVPPLWAPKAKVATMDWTSACALARVCQDIDAVVHLAAMNAEQSAQNPVGALEFNGVGTARLIRAAIEQRVTRFVVLSTAHVYGAALRGDVDEDTPTDPRHPYATSHRAGEDVVRSAHRNGEIQGIVVRLSNSFGAPADLRADCWSLLVNDLCRQAVRTRRMELKTTGVQRRDFVPISEACRAILHLLTLPANMLGDGIFNVGREGSLSVREVAEIVASRAEILLGFNPEIQWGSVKVPGGIESLNYRVRRLAESGFESSATAIADEIDGLLTFCVRHEVAPK